jgi:RNA polymerase sigma-70 factor (ECF subfamily)
LSSDEKLLLERAKSGDIEAFEKLIMGSEKKVYNIALKMTGSHDDAMDLSQEVFIKVYKSLNKFKEEASFFTWIYRITHNICIDEIRKKKKVVSISLDEEYESDNGNISRQFADNSLGPLEQLEIKEDMVILKKAIVKLSPQHRVALIMRDIQGMTYEQISEILKCPQGTVKSRINRARYELKEIIKSSFSI